ncbi:MAG: hypothetical protein FWD57_06560, partial [Polyangiaceae bacterium]|nr:hypothetical protein [Polyangiaceae bacterium]
SAPTQTPDEPKPSEPSKGADSSTATFSAWLESGGTPEAGKPTVATAVLIAKAPYKCNQSYPYKFTVDKSSRGVSFPQDTVRGMQIAPTRSTMSIPFVPLQEGPAVISGTLYFSVCTDERCLIEQTKLSVSINVK